MEKTLHLIMEHSLCGSHISETRVSLFRYGLFILIQMKSRNTHMALPIYSATGSETDLEDGINFFVGTIDKKYSKNERIRLIVLSFCILPNSKFRLLKKVISIWIFLRMFFFENRAAGTESGDCRGVPSVSPIHLTFFEVENFNSVKYKMTVRWAGFVHF